MTDYLFYIITFLGSVLLSVGLMLLVRRSVEISTLESHHEVAGFIYAVVGVIYAVLIAFAVLVVWEQHNQAEERIDNEAADIIRIYSNSQGMENNNFRNKMKILAKDYIKTMIDEEFPAMAKYKFSACNAESFRNIWLYLYTIKPDNDNDKFWFDKTVEAQNKLSETRRLRKISVNYSVPLFMWIVLICGAFVTITFSFLFGTKKALPQILMVVALSSSVVLVLILIGALEHPYSGIIKVEPEAFMDALRILH
ncbi:MAG: hypothetical protein QG635_587 [Bacteroidota bacterium]|nr:hypothetical protein [Bacteroidota bacterium]